MPSKSIAIYATAAIASIITYVITAFSRGTRPAMHLSGSLFS